VSPRATAVSASVLSLALFLPLGLYQAIGFDFSSVGFAGWASVVHYGAFVTALGYLLWFGGLAKVPASTAGVFTGVLSVSAVLLCYLVLGEPFSWAHQVVAEGNEVSLIPERRREGLEGLPRAGRVVVIISGMCRKGALDRGREDSGCAGR
jgi:drug/metabolite transporter (DMT)-like permease